MVSSQLSPIANSQPQFGVWAEVWAFAELRLAADRCVKRERKPHTVQAHSRTAAPSQPDREHELPLQSIGQTDRVYR